MRISYTEETAIRELLVGRSVVSVDGDSLTLDNGTVIDIDPNEGCGGCSNGHYDVESISTVENVITDVSFAEEGDEETRKTYSIFVYTGSVQGEGNKLFTVAGSDGNGYYGTGYRLLVR